MTDRNIHYFARGNTAQGLFHLTESVFQDLQAIYVLQGYPGGTDEFILRLANACSYRNFKLQLIHQPLDNDWLEGIIIEERSVAIIDGEAWNEELQSSGAEIHFIDLTVSLDHEKLLANVSRIEGIEQKIKRSYDKAYETFLRTLRIHDDWEKLYIDNLDRERMNQLAVEWCDDYLQPVVISGQQDGEQDCPSAKLAKVSHRFLGAATWRGAVDYIPNLTDQLSTRIFVKGRPGSGKSTLFTKIADTAAQRGIDTEIYHCGFDPHSLDMLIFPELSLAIFDSTAPHEHFPIRDGDVILDVYSIAITEGTDEKYADEIREVRQQYSNSMRQSIAYLAEVKEYRDELVSIYEEAADRSIISSIEENLLKELSQAGSSDK